MTASQFSALFVSALLANTGDALIDPMETREVLALALEVALNRPRATALVLETL